MKRDIVLLIVMLLLVVSFADESQTYQDVVVANPMNYVLSQTEMPIYELITPVVNESYVQSLASSLFGIHDVMAEETEGIYYVQWGNSCLEVDSADGSIWYADYDRLWNISSGDELPNQGDSQDLVEAWVDETGLIPANGAFKGVGFTNATIYNAETHDMYSKIIHYHFNYDFYVDDFPIAEEAAQISVIVGESGDIPGSSQNIVALDWKWRDIQSTPYTTAVLIEFDSLMSEQGISASDIVDYRLAYDTGEEDSDNDYLYPVYEVELLKTDDVGNDIIINLQFDATEFAPIVQIVSPATSITVKPGVPIYFDCVIAFGTPPYKMIWHSGFDGPLSTKDNFTISTLSEVLKYGEPVPHCISVAVGDSEDRWTTAVVAVTIDSNAPLQINVNIVLIALGALVVLSFSVIILKKKASFALLLLLMLFSAFMFIPIVSAQSETNNVKVFTPSEPTGAYDDGIKEVGVEWVGMSYPASDMLYYSQYNIDGFYDHMGSIGGYSQEFNWGEWSAWEEDFKSKGFGGNDTEWIDAVDFVYYQGHGGPNSVSFTSEKDSKWIQFYKLLLGDGDLETLALDSCSTLAWEGKNGYNVFERWKLRLAGVHMICGFATSSKNTKTMGPNFASYLTGLYPLPPLTTMEAWFRAAIESQPGGYKAAVFYGTNSTNPFQPQLDDPINDHAKGFGYVCDDPIPSRIAWYVYIWTSC